MFGRPKIRQNNLAIKIALLLWWMLFSISIYSQSERDSITILLSQKNLLANEKWNILAPFLNEKIGNWSTDYFDYADTLVSIATHHLPYKLPEAYSILGNSYFNANELDEALTAYQLGLTHAHQSTNAEATISLYGGIGKIFLRQEQYINALEYLTKSLDLATIHEDTVHQVQNHINISLIMVENSKLETSSYHIYRARDLAEEANITSQLTSIYNNIIFLEDEKGNYAIARENTYKLLELAHKIGDQSAQYFGYGNLGYAYGKHSQQYDSAVFYLKLGLEYFDPDHNEIETLPAFYQAISENYEAMGNGDSAIVYLKLYTTLHDSIQRKHFDENVQEIEGKYQSNVKEKLIIQALLDAEHQANLKRLSIGIGLGIIAFLFGLFQYIRNRQKSKHYRTELSLKVEQSKAQQMLELDKLKSNFFANISHEFRTPLTLILGPIEQLKNNEFKGDIHKYAPMMYRNAHRLKELTNQLLDLSKIESGQMRLLLEDGDIFQFCRQLISSFESWAEQKELNFEFEIPTISLWVQFDRDKVEKIIGNLISNAIKYTPEKGSVSITIDSEQIGKKVKVKGEIRDSGFGILKADQEFIFQRFFQSYNNKNGSASSGLGLALSKELIELHRGSISFNSSENEGTQFIFEIPFTASLVIPIEEPLYNTVRREPSVAENNYKFNKTSKLISRTNKNHSIVLIVEDNRDVRHYIIDQMKDQFEILEAEDGQKGLSMAVESIPDLIITDLMMPRMNGIELTRCLKTDERTSHIPVIMLTAKADLHNKLEGLETGADDFLTKPFNAKELELRVKNAINQRKLLTTKIMNSGLRLSPKGISVNSVDEKFLNRLVEFLEEEIDNEQLSVTELSRMIGMSRSQLHRKLTALVDKTPNAFIRTFRMQRAHDLLVKKAGNISEIAIMVGFNSLTYFSKCFTDEFGYNPTKVLKNK